MRRALSKLLPEDDWLVEKRSYNRGLMTRDRSIRLQKAAWHIAAAPRGGSFICGGSFHCHFVLRNKETELQLNKVAAIFGVQASSGRRIRLGRKPRCRVFR